MGLCGLNSIVVTDTDMLTAQLDCLLPRACTQRVMTTNVRL